MKIAIDIPKERYDLLIRHLYPKDIKVEEAAFVFADTIEKDGEFNFRYMDHMLAQKEDFAFQSAYHIELTDEFRKVLIRRAHEFEASIIEFHSHVGQKQARFSSSDWNGFSEFVPHVFWRLSNRPYAAVVVTKYNCDGFVWIDDPTRPYMLDRIRAGSEIITPTHLSYKKWIHES